MLKFFEKNYQTFVNQNKFNNFQDENHQLNFDKTLKSEKFRNKFNCFVE